jgi:hypothetical protein
MSNPRDTVGFRGEAPLFGPALVLILAVLALALLAHDARNARSLDAPVEASAPAATIGSAADSPVDAAEMPAGAVTAW